jgi:hypothetical protein
MSISPLMPTTPLSFSSLSSGKHSSQILSPMLSMPGLISFGATSRKEKKLSSIKTYSILLPINTTVLLLFMIFNKNSVMNLKLLTLDKLLSNSLKNHILLGK